MTQVRYLAALARALRDEMAADPGVFVIGEDVRESLRGVTRGLFEEFGADRVLDMPISEQMFTGFATGAALAGRRCVVEYQIPSLLYLAFEQIANQAQKLRLMTGGQAKVPVVYLVPGSGARRGLAAQHSDHPYSLFAHAGVKTVLPSTSADAYGLMLSAIRDDDPVLYLAPAAVLPFRSELADDPAPIPLGSGRIHRSGSDVTVVAVGHLVHDALAVAEELEGEVSIEVVDPRTLYPFDWELLGESIGRTRRLVVVDDSNRTCGLGAEIVATVAEEMDLVARPRRITRADAPVAFAVELEQAVLPSREQIAAAVRAAAAEGRP
jgi:acetoin:2,6-dichlorophenolindophenol oxidoreductase subunit beta